MMGPCPNVHRLKGLLEGGVSHAETRSLTSHLDSCRECQKRLESLAGASHLIPAPTSATLTSTEALQPWPTDTGLMRLMADLRQTASQQDESSTHEANVVDLERPTFIGVSDRPGYLGSFGPFEVIKIVGRGGMGVVLKAYDSALDRIVAVKVLSPQLATSDEARKRFSREARSAATVVHNHILAIHAVAAANGLPYLVTPFVSGGSLQDWIDQHGAMAMTDVIRLGRQIASGLTAAHARGLVHRDIKPTNILLEEGRSESSHRRFRFSTI